MVEDDVTGAGNLAAMMVGGRSTMGMNLIQRQKIAYLCCRMTTFNLPFLSMNLSLRESTCRHPLCQNTAVITKKTEKTDCECSFFLQPCYLQCRKKTKRRQKVTEDSYTNGGARRELQRWTHVLTGDKSQLSPVNKFEEWLEEWLLTQKTGGDKRRERKRERDYGIFLISSF